jgi:polygalacturonase
MFTFVQCTDVLVTDLTIRNSSCGTLVPIFSKGITFQRLHITQGSHPGQPEHPDHHSNTDGFDPLGSEDVRFEDSFYEGPGDDCVAIKSGLPVNYTIPYYDVCRRPTRRIYVNNVTCIAAHGITIGSEISGGVEDVEFTNMRLLSSVGLGIAMIKIKLVCNRGSFVRNFHYENMTASNVGQGIYISTYGTSAHTKSCNDTGTTRVSNITVKNVYVESVAYPAFEVAGFKMQSPSELQITGMRLDNVTVKKFKTAGHCSNADVSVMGQVWPRFPTCRNDGSYNGRDVLV